MNVFSSYEITSCYLFRTFPILGDENTIENFKILKTP